LPVLSMLSGGRHLSPTELARRAKIEQPSTAQLLIRMRPRPVGQAVQPDLLTREAERRLPAGRR
jgi:hypothetical protein